MRIQSLRTRTTFRGAALAWGLLLAACSTEATIDLFPRSLSEASPTSVRDAGPESTNQELDAALGGVNVPSSDAQVTPAGSGGTSAQGGAGGAGVDDEEPTTGGGATGGPSVTLDASAVGFLPVHRYRFDGPGDVAVDDIGGADGVIVGGATQDGFGAVALDGNDDFVDLPNGIVSSLTDATFSAWIRWHGNNCWHRIFSFGSTVQGEDIVGDASTELFVTPVNCPFAGQQAGLTALFEVQGQASSGLLTSVAFDAELHHVVLAFEDAGPTMTLYLDGAAVGSGPACCRLSDLVDENNWLGQSQWEQDYRFPGVFEAFSIYDQALTPAQVSILFATGPE